MRPMPVLRISCFVLVMFLVACTQEQRTDQLRERTADATAALKRDAKAVAQGIHEGWTRENPLNVNSATREQLQQLPGIDQARADHIIARRPVSELYGQVFRIGGIAGEQQRRMDQRRHRRTLAEHQKSPVADLPAIREMAQWKMDYLRWSTDVDQSLSKVLKPDWKTAGIQPLKFRETAPSEVGATGVE